MVDTRMPNGKAGQDRDYALYWLTVSSEIELPEVAPLGDWDAGPRVTVRLGTVPDVLRNGEPRHHWLSVLPDQCVFTIKGVASYCIEDGERIVVQPEPGADDAEVRTFLLGASFAALSHQRGALLLHVSSVVTPEGAVAFTGASGAGKSTMAASLHKEHGWPVVSDDAAAVRIVEGVPMIFSGVRRLRLWQDAALRLGVDTTGATRDLCRDDKFQVPYPEHFASRPVPLVGLSWLSSKDAPYAPPRHPVALITKAIHRPELLLPAHKALQFQDVLRVSQALCGAGTRRSAP